MPRLTLHALSTNHYISSPSLHTFYKFTPFSLSLITVIHTNTPLALSLSLNMWKSFVTSFNKLWFDEVGETRKPALNAKPIYRDELDQKNASKKKVEKNSEKKSYGGSSVDKKEVMTVKVKMTKQEAARMLSKCKGGGFLDFKDVAHELVLIPPNRVTVVSADQDTINGQVLLKSIPEEL